MIQPFWQGCMFLWFVWLCTGRFKRQPYKYFSECALAFIVVHACFAARLKAWKFDSQTSRHVPGQEWFQFKRRRSLSCGKSLSMAYQGLNPFTDSSTVPFFHLSLIIFTSLYVSSVHYLRAFGLLFSNSPKLLRVLARLFKYKAAIFYCTMKIKSINVTSYPVLS